ncbi:MAG: DEAD/DEAH box helicase, partial [Deltaproteobacteria bacterium]|nr:DEAD/DEAH box helicase [Deltaproteobacteria bacterium]
MTLLGEHPVEITDQSFESLGLEAAILESVRKVGFVHPTPIQKEVIPQALQGRDLIGLAQTGSGKTAAFVIPIASRLSGGQGLRGLILCPTREIALQTKNFLDLFGRHHHLKTVCLIGGVAMGPQINDLRRRHDIIVATPGRLFDHLERRNVFLDKIEEMVLDEADHMLDLGFLPQIQRIMEWVPPRRHTMMFSATMPPAIERLARQYL